jgi:hypothetical protein
MAASSLAPNPAPSRPPRPRPPAILWHPVAAAAVGSAVLVVALLAVIPPRHAPAAPAEEACAPLPAVEQARPEFRPTAPDPMPAAPAPAANIPAAPLTVKAAPVPALPEPVAATAIAPEVESNAFVNLPDAAGPKATACGQYGTAVDFCDSPVAALKTAAKDQKLVFVLHVAGNFEEPGFT